MAFDWTQYASGGALRPDSFSGMKPEFSGALQQLIMNAPPEIQKQLQVYSGYRSPERQAALWEGALKKYGSPEIARKWVAPPGRSNHGHGQAADLKFLDKSAREWVHQNASNYGLAFPLGNEPWHVELASARGGKAAPQVASGMAALVNRPQVEQQPVPIQADGPKGQEAYPQAAPPLSAPRTIADAPIGTPQPTQAPQPQQSAPQGLLAMLGGGGEAQGAANPLLSMLAAAQPQQAPQMLQPPQGPQQPSLADYITQFMQARTA